MADIVRQGRGAWPSDGRGGTYRTNRLPGPYYLYAPEKGWNMVGLPAVLKFLDGQQIPFDELAVHYGVRAIQRLLNTCPNLDGDVKVDGVFGEATDTAVRKLQKIASVTVDGVVGVKTMKNLLFFPVLDLASAHTTSWEAIWGILHYEGGWDPGAVGYIDRNDLGLAQVNLVAHPTVSVEKAFDPFWAIEFIANYLENAGKYLDGNLRDMVASYNLGIGGTKQWITDGRPDRWLPSWSTLAREPNKYIDKILGAHLL